MVRLDRGVRLGVIWVVYRGDAKAVTFEPRKVPVADGKASTTVRFSKPGTYMLRALRRRWDSGGGEGRHGNSDRRSGPLTPSRLAGGCRVVATLFSWNRS